MRFAQMVVGKIGGVFAKDNPVFRGELQDFRLGKSEQRADQHGFFTGRRR